MIVACFVWCYKTQGKAQVQTCRIFSSNIKCFFPFFSLFSKFIIFLTHIRVTLEPSVNLSLHVNVLSRSIKYHLRNLWRVRRFINKSTCHAAARALVLSRQDYQSGARLEPQSYRKDLRSAVIR